MRKAGKKFQSALLFDLSAAYDLLDRDLFLKKAEIVGITGAALRWLASYLTDRKQTVEVNSARSSIRKLNCGTPQGSSCSCLVFALFVGDIGMWIHGGDVQAYADDTFISLEADSIEELQERMENAGEKVLDYFNQNRMVTNPAKTAMLIFRPTSTKAKGARVQITLAGETINESESEKLLGVCITEDLKWNSQIEKLISEMNYGVSVLWRLRRVLGNREMKLIADGLITSKIRYALPVHGVELLRTTDSQPNSGLLQSIQKVQNNVLRIITGHKRSEHVRITDMLKATSQISVNQLIAYSCLMETWKARAFNVPVIASLLDNKRDDSRSLRSDTHGLVRSSVDEPFANNTAKLWNLASERFRSTNLLVIAKIEAKKLAISLPV